MSYERLAARLYNTPLLITPEKAETIEQVFRAHLTGTVAELPKFTPEERVESPMLAAMNFSRVQRGGYLRSSETGIAIIQVVGSLVQRASGLDAMSGIESYENLGAQLAAALADRSVRGILLEIDSYGGEATGIAALSSAIRAGLQEKPIFAHANERAFSGAHWIGTSAEEFHVTPMGMVGSIGVITMHVDRSREIEKRGITVTHITAGKRKADLSPFAPLTDEAHAAAQGAVDRIYGHFVSHVASTRDVSEKVVRDTEAGLLHPDQAIDLKLVDRISTFDQTLERLADVVAQPKTRKQHGGAKSSAPSSTGQLQETDMTDATKPAAAANPPAATMFTQDQVDAARAAGVAEGKASASAEATKVATEAERTRIAGITGHAEAAGREKLAAHLAHKTSMSVEDAGAMLAAAPKEAATAANPLAAAMAAEAKNPKVGADADADEGGDTEANVGARIGAFGAASRKLKAVK